MMNAVVRELSNLVSLRREADTMAEEIARLRARMAGCRRFSETSAWRPEQVEEMQARMSALVERLAGRVSLCLRERERLGTFIETIDSSQMRQIMTLRYCMGKTWNAIAFAIGDYDEQYPRKLHNRFVSQVERTGGIDAWIIKYADSERVKTAASQ